MKTLVITSEEKAVMSIIDVFGIPYHIGQPSTSDRLLMAVFLFNMFNEVGKGAEVISPEKQ